jgi:hypothetical protein
MTRRGRSPTAIQNPDQQQGERSERQIDMKRKLMYPPDKAAPDDKDANKPGFADIKGGEAEKPGQSQHDQKSAPTREDR